MSAIMDPVTLGWCLRATSPPRVLAVLRRFESLAAEIQSVDPLALGSSKGGSGTAVGPKASR